MDQTSCRETRKKGKTEPSWVEVELVLGSATNHHPMDFWSLFPFKGGYSLAASADKELSFLLPSPSGLVVPTVLLGNIKPGHIFKLRVVISNFF